MVGLPLPLPGAPLPGPPRTGPCARRGRHLRLPSLGLRLRRRRGLDSGAGGLGLRLRGLLGLDSCVLGLERCASALRGPLPVRKDLSELVSILTVLVPEEKAGAFFLLFFRFPLFLFFAVFVVFFYNVSP